ncbi:MAG: hypothetical protein KKG60_02720 [Nanoarchaeota archaeon]|nr:hypothetical protein [Nanoarchaeota archaeon]
MEFPYAPEDLGLSKDEFFSLTTGICDVSKIIINKNEENIVLALGDLFFEFDPPERNPLLRTPDLIRE